MPARRKISMRQMELLVEFAEAHRDIALGRFPGGPQAVRATRGLWDSVAVQLNSVADGVTKTPDQWRRYWIEFKAKTKSKAADSRRSAAATGGGPSKLVPLTSIEEKVLAIIDPVAVEGLPGVCLPIDDTDNSTESTNNTTDNAVDNDDTNNKYFIITSKETESPATRPENMKTTQDPLTTDILPSMKDHLKRPATASAPEDRYDLLGRSIAIKLRSLNKRQRLMTEKIINDTLFDAEMDNLEG